MMTISSAATKRENSVRQPFLSAMIQCFSLTTKQYQPAYKPQKWSSEHAMMMMQDFRYCNLLQDHQHLMIVCRQWMRRSHGISASAKIVLLNQCEWHPHDQVIMLPPEHGLSWVLRPWTTSVIQTNLSMVNWGSQIMILVTEPSWIGTINSIHFSIAGTVRVYHWNLHVNQTIC